MSIDLHFGPALPSQPPLSPSLPSLPALQPRWPPPGLGLAKLPPASGLLHVLFSLTGMLFPLMDPLLKQCEASLPTSLTETPDTTTGIPLPPGMGCWGSLLHPQDEIVQHLINMVH